jgi:hypothetical protein
MTKTPRITMTLSVEEQIGFRPRQSWTTLTYVNQW